MSIKILIQTATTPIHGLSIHHARKINFTSHNERFQNKELLLSTPHTCTIPFYEHFMIKAKQKLVFFIFISWINILKLYEIYTEQHAHEKGKSWKLYVSTTLKRLISTNKSRTCQSGTCSFLFSIFVTNLVIFRHYQKRTVKRTRTRHECKSRSIECCFNNQSLILFYRMYIFVL